MPKRAKADKPKTDLVVCESSVAITTHLRSTKSVPPNYHGHSQCPRALCGAEIAWDTMLPISDARCRACREKMKLGRMIGEP